MEPTIYKPSIYKGAGIYKAGAEGGGLGPYGVDWVNGGWSNKQLFRRQNASVTNGGTHDWYDVPCFGFVAPFSSDRKTTPGVYPYHRSDFKREDEQEIKISFMFNKDYPDSVILCGNYNTNYNQYPSLEAKDNGMIFLMSTTANWGDCFMVLPDVNILNKKRKKQTLILKHFANTDKFKLSYLVDNVLLSEKENTLSNIKWVNDNSNIVILGGIKDNINNAVQRDCWILYESYFKVNGDFLPNKSSNGNFISNHLDVFDYWPYS